MDREFERPIEIPIRWIYYVALALGFVLAQFVETVPLGLFIGVFFGTALLIFWVNANPDFDLIKFT